MSSPQSCPHNVVNFGLLTAEIHWRVWGTPANFNGFRVLAALLHDTLVVGVSQTLRHSTEGATYIRQGGHHVGYWPSFLVVATLVKVERQKMHVNINSAFDVNTKHPSDAPTYIDSFIKCSDKPHNGNYQ